MPVIIHLTSTVYQPSTCNWDATLRIIFQTESVCFFDSCQCLHWKWGESIIFAVSKPVNQGLVQCAGFSCDWKASWLVRVSWLLQVCIKMNSLTNSQAHVQGVASKSIRDPLWLPCSKYSFIHVYPEWFFSWYKSSKELQLPEMRCNDLMSSLC